MTDPARPPDADLTGRVFIVTGANAGVGLVTTAALAQRDAHVILACRSVQRAEAAVADIRRQTERGQLEILQLDLGSLASVREAAARFLERGLPLHVLVNNAGLLGKRGHATADGFELAFGVNHLGHFLLTQLLLERLKESAPARVVTVSSRSHYRAKSFDFEPLRQPSRSYSGFPEYSRSKLANVLFSAELARRLEGTGVTTYALHPGVVASSIWRDVPWPIRKLMMLFATDLVEGARAPLYCATAPEVAGQTGLFYYPPGRPTEPSPLAQRRSLAGDLWERSEAWTETDSRQPRE